MLATTAGYHARKALEPGSRFSIPGPGSGASRVLLRTFQGHTTTRSCAAAAATGETLLEVRIAVCVGTSQDVSDLGGETAELSANQTQQHRATYPMLGYSSLSVLQGVLNRKSGGQPQIPSSLQQAHESFSGRCGGPSRGPVVARSSRDVEGKVAASTSNINQKIFCEHTIARR